MDLTAQLQKLIKTSINDNNLEKLNLFFDSETDSSEAFNEATILTLFKMLKTNEKHEEKSLKITCVLSCIQHFVRLNLDTSKWESLAEEVARLCELTFILSASYIKDDCLIQRNVDCFLELLNCDTQSRIFADNLLRYMLEMLLKSSLSFSYPLKLSMLGLAAAILLKSSRTMRLEIVPRTTIYIEKLTNLLLVTGDYEMQVAIVELLARCWVFVKENGIATSLFSNSPKIDEVFNNYSFLNFDPDCRLFLNEMNKYMGENEKQLVYSIPCLVVSTDNNYLKKPKDIRYREFWVDFNLSPKSISFYHQPVDATEWELLKIEERLIYHASSSYSMCKGKHGNVIPTVKIEIKLKSDVNIPTLPKIVKLYPRKTPEFFKIEKAAIQKILGEKYKSEADHDNLSPSQSQLKPHEAELFQLSSFMEVNTIKMSKENSPNKVSSLPSPRSKTQHVRGEQKSEVNKSVDYSAENSPAVINLEKGLVPRNNKYTEHVKSLGNGLVSSRVTNISKKSEINSPFPAVDLTKQHSADKYSANSNDIGSFRKRRLFSDEHNNTKDLVLSSQEDFSVDVPDYKLSKKEHRVNQNSNVDRKHISYSYIREKEKQSGSVKAATLFSDVLCDYEIQSELLKNTKSNGKSKSPHTNNKRKYFKSAENDDKKLRALNKTPESVKRCNIFEAQSVYSDLSPLASNSLITKTYGRTKPRRCRKKVNYVVESSDDDDYISPSKGLSDPNTDYVPTKKKSPGLHVERKTAFRKSRNVKKTFVDCLGNREVDSIRDISHADDMEVEFMDQKKPQFAPRKVEVPSPINDTKLQKSKNRKVVNTGKKEVKNNTTTKKGKFGSQTRKTKQTTEILGSFVMTSTFANRSENMDDFTPIPLPPPTLEIVNYDPSAINYNELEKYDESNTNGINPLAQNKAMLQSTFKFNEMVEFGRTCLAHTSNDIFRAQSLHRKEREMNYAKFDFKVHSSILAIQNEGEKLIAINNKLMEMKSVLEQTHTIQKEIAVGIQNEITKLNDARQALMSNTNKIENTEVSQTRSIVQEFGKIMRNLVFSFIGNKNNNTELK